jgi:hypothetical protein
MEFNRSRLGPDVERIIMERVDLPEAGSYEIRADHLTRERSTARTRSYEVQN